MVERVSLRIATVLLAYTSMSAVMPPAQATTPGTELWTATFGGGRFGGATAIAASGSSVFVAGSYAKYYYDYEHDRMIVAYDADTGFQLWLDLFDGWLDADYASDIAVGPKGTRVFVTGESYVSYRRSYDYVTTAYRADTGARLWTRRYDGPSGSYDEARAIYVGPSGRRVFVTGTSDGSSATIAYRTDTGATLWTRRYDGPADGAEDARDIVVGPSGRRVFVTGTSTGSGDDSDYSTIAYRADTGATLWARPYDGPASLNDDAREIVVGPDGKRLFVTGMSKGTGIGADYATIAYRAKTGAKVWSTRFDGPAGLDDRATTIGIHPSGTLVFVSGVSEGSVTGSDAATIAYRTDTGAKVWTRRIAGGVITDLVVTPSGAQVLIASSSTVAYEADTGVEAWTASSSSLAEAIAGSPDETMTFVMADEITTAYSLA
jgi:hypothetical protein